jgi:hypothetical protein
VGRIQEVTVSILHRPDRLAVEDRALLDGQVADARWGEARWEDVLSRLPAEPFRVPEPWLPPAGLCCRWEPDPAHPGRMRSVWSPGPPGP